MPGFGACKSIPLCARFCEAPSGKSTLRFAPGGENPDVTYAEVPPFSRTSTAKSEPLAPADTGATASGMSAGGGILSGARKMAAMRFRSASNSGL